MLPSMGPIMSSMPILDPAPEPMETDIPSEEVIMIWFVCKYVCECLHVCWLLCMLVHCVAYTKSVWENVRAV